MRTPGWLGKSAVLALLAAAARPGPAQGQHQHQLEPDPATCEGYPERRVFLEAQGWWVPMAGQTGTDNGHVHSGTCFPWSGFGQSLSGTVRFDVRVVMHMNPGVLKHVKIQGSTDGSAVELAALQPGFQCSETTCVRWYTLYADTAKLPADGRVEFRIHAHTQKSDGTRLFSSTGWQARVANGGGRPIVDYRRTDDFTEGRGWYGFNGASPPDLGYQNARLADPLPIEPVSGVWSPSVVLDAGSGGEPPTSHMAAVDPNFHEGRRGLVIKEGPGSFRGRINIDTTQLSDGPHKLVLRTDFVCEPATEPTLCADPDRNATHSGLLAIPFTVANGGGQPPPAPAPDVTPPTVSITAPAEGASISGTANVTASASDNVGVSKVELYVDGVLKATDASAPYAFTLDTAPLGNGSRVLRAKAYDAAGNSASDSATVTIDNHSPPPPPPPPPSVGPAIDANSLSVPASVNAWKEDLRVRARVLAGSGALATVELVHTEVGGHSFAHRRAMAPEAGGGGYYSVVLPPAFTALKAGRLGLRVEVRDAGGLRAASAERWALIENFFEGPPDASGIVRFPHRLGSGGATQADFSFLPPGERPALVRIRLLPPGEHAASREAEIDRRFNGGAPLAAYEITTPGARTFSRAVRLVLAYRDPGGGVPGLGVFHHDGVQWRLMSRDEDASRRVASVRTSHFSKFAVFAVDEAGLKTAEALRSKERFITPSLRDGINDEAVFGLEARKVEIFDLTGRGVFTASGTGGPLSWDGRDASGRVVESGAYVAKITDADDQRHYQIIVVAK